MSPVLNCVPSNPILDKETYAKLGNTPLEPSNRSPTEVALIKQNEDPIDSETFGCDNARTDTEDVKRFSPNNNNNVPINYKKSSSHNEDIAFDNSIASWNSSPNSKNGGRAQSLSPSSSTNRPSPYLRSSVSPDASSESSRIPSHTSSETQDLPVSHDSSSIAKASPIEIPSETPFPFHENGLSPDSFRLSNSFLADPMNPYLRLSGHALNPFQPPPDFIINPFLGTNDPKLLLSNPGLGLITQQLHHLNGISLNSNKVHPSDLQRVSLQQLQFLQNHFQSLPALFQPAHYTKYPDPKNQLSMLLQARKQSKSSEFESENRKDNNCLPKSKMEDLNKSKDRSVKFINSVHKSRKASTDDRMEVEPYEDNNSDSDELLSVGSVSPPPNCQTTLKRADTVKQNDGLSGFNCSSSVFTNRTLNPNAVKKYSTSNSPVRLQDNLTSTKPSNTSNRTLKFSIDNILKSDFGNEDVVKKPKQVDSKKDKESEKNSSGKKKSETEKETPVDLSQENSNSSTGTDAPMLWPAWVYCTRYSDRPSSGKPYHLYFYFYNYSCVIHI